MTRRVLHRASRRPPVRSGGAVDQVHVLAGIRLIGNARGRLVLTVGFVFVVIVVVVVVAIDADGLSELPQADSESPSAAATANAGSRRLHILIDSLSITRHAVTLSPAENRSMVPPANFGSPAAWACAARRARDGAVVSEKVASPPLPVTRRADPAVTHRTVGKWRGTSCHRSAVLAVPGEPRRRRARPWPERAAPRPDVPAAAANAVDHPAPGKTAVDLPCSAVWPGACPGRIVDRQAAAGLTIRSIGQYVL